VFSKTGIHARNALAALAEHHELAEALAKSLALGEEHLDQLGPAA
jgi:hypothetical protein